MWNAAHKPTSRCAVTGASAHQLKKLRIQLQIDRIDPNAGYIKGNMRLLAAPLNRAKADEPEIPPRAIMKLEARLAALSHDKLSQA